MFLKSNFNVLKKYETRLYTNFVILTFAGHLLHSLATASNFHPRAKLK